jgi:hypothetical protein
VAGGALREAAAQDHVLDLRRVEARALDGMLDGVPGHGGAVGVVEGAAEGLADRRACRRDDHRFTH